MLLAPGSAEAAHSSTVAGADRFATAAAQAAQAYPARLRRRDRGRVRCLARRALGCGARGRARLPDPLHGQGRRPRGNRGRDLVAGASEVVLIGDERRVSERGEAALGSTGAVKSCRRVCGRDRYETQQAVYDFGRGGYDGVDRWGRGLAVLASGASFPDALSASPLAASEAAPIFLVDPAIRCPPPAGGAPGGRLLAHCRAGRRGSRVRAGPGVRQGAHRARLAHLNARDAVRLGGADRYETSAALARWCVQEGYLLWDGAAFTSGTRPTTPWPGACCRPRGARSCFWRTIRPTQPSSLPPRTGAVCPISCILATRLRCRRIFALRLSIA